MQSCGVARVELKSKQSGGIVGRGQAFGRPVGGVGIGHMFKNTRQVRKRKCKTNSSAEHRNCRSFSHFLCAKTSLTVLMRDL